MLIPKISIVKKHILLVLIAFGSMLFTSGIFLISYQKTVLSFKETPKTVSVLRLTDSTPKEIIIEDIGINLPVSEGIIYQGVWEISTVGATHLDISTRPGEGGNIVIYGHNRKNIFGSLPKIKKDAVIRVITNDGTIFKYKVVNTMTVKPSAMEYVSPTSAEILTIYTCNGFLDTTRFIVQAEPI